MTDGHLCTRWFERGLGCPFDGAAWHTFSYNPDEDFHFDEYPPEEDGKGPEESPVDRRGDREKPEENKRTRSSEDPYDYDEWLDNNGLRSSSIAFTSMGYHIYGSLLLQQQIALKTRMTSAGNLNVAPFTSSGGYLAAVEAAEIAVATRVGTGSTRLGLEGRGTSSTQLTGLSVGDAAAIIVWATAVGVVFGLTRGQGPTGPMAAIASARLMPPEILAWIANFGKTSPGIIGETILLVKLAGSWLYETREMGPLPERYKRTVYNQNAWADPGLG